MNSFKWDFKPKKIVGELSAEKLEELLFDYLASLYQNGQICRDFELIKTDGSGGYAACAILPEDDALDEKYADEAVRKSSKKIGACFDVSVSCLGRKYGLRRRLPLRKTLRLRTVYDRAAGKPRDVSALRGFRAALQNSDFERLRPGGGL